MTTTSSSDGSRPTFWQSVLRSSGDRDALTARQGWRIFGGVLAFFASYGLAAGFFQGDQQLLVSAFKFPLIVTASLLLCLPSLYVFAVLAGAQLTVRVFLTAVLGFAGRLSLLAVAMLPIVWLFSVSTRFLFLIVMMHFVIWGSALVLSSRALAWPGRPARGVVALWLLLVLLVSLQVATVSRPVLLREARAPFFESGKVFFLEHFENVAGKESP
jgi:hypothetical protein